MKGTFKLLGILALLIGVYFIIQYTGDRGRSKSLRSELVEIDTAAVTKLRVKRGEEQVLVTKQEGAWQLELKNGRKVAATNSSMRSAFNSLTSIKPGRLAAKDESKWKDYQVDSTGTRVEVFEGEKKTLDLVIGRFSMEGQQQFSTYVRLFDEPEVYAAPNFMGASLTATTASYRNQQLARFNRDSVYQVTFNYPDSSFSLNKVDGKWLLNNAPADSANTAKYLQSIGYLTSRNFADDFTPVGSPLLGVTFQLNGGEPLNLHGFKPDGGLVVTSSANPEEYFRDQALGDKVFKGAGYFKGN